MTIPYIKPGTNTIVNKTKLIIYFFTHLPLVTDYLGNPGSFYSSRSTKGLFLELIDVSRLQRNFKLFTSLSRSRDVRLKHQVLIQVIAIENITTAAILIQDAGERKYFQMHIVITVGILPNSAGHKILTIISRNEIFIFMLK